MKKYRATFDFYYGDNDYKGDLIIDTDDLEEIKRAARGYFLLRDIQERFWNDFCNFTSERQDEVSEEFKAAMAEIGYDWNHEEDDEYYSALDKFQDQVLGFEWPFNMGELAAPHGYPVEVIEIAREFKINKDGESL